VDLCYQEFDLGKQLLRFERFQDVVIRADFPRIYLDVFFLRILRRKYDYRYAACCLIGFQFPSYITTVFSRQHDIQKDEVRFFGFRDLHGPDLVLFIFCLAFYSRIFFTAPINSSGSNGLVR